MRVETFIFSTNNRIEWNGRKSEKKMCCFFVATLFRTQTFMLVVRKEK